MRGPGLRRHDPKMRKLQRSELLFYEPYLFSRLLQILDIRQNLTI